jgi:adenosine deaminase
MRPSTVPDMSIERQGWAGPLEPGWERTYYTYSDFAGFMAQLTPRFPGTPAEYARIAAECFEDLAPMNVICAEINVDGIIQGPGEENRFWPIMDALEEERRRAEARYSMRLNYIIGLMRTLPVEAAMERVRLAAEARRRGMGVVGIDLHGDEEKGPAEPFAPAFRLAASYGLGTRAHAGEADGAESVRTVVNILGVPRVAHGLRALEDPALVEQLRRDNITLELCPTSNVRTGVVPNLRSHPIRTLHDLGVQVTVNSDDPLPFFTDIEREYRLLVDELGFSLEALRQITINAARIAFLNERERLELIERVNAGFDLAASEFKAKQNETTT